MTCWKRLNISAVGVLIVAVAGTIIGFAVLGDLLGSHLWLIDDHHILTTRARMGTGFSGFFSFLTEPGGLRFTGGRIRPTFSLLWAAEMFLWGENASLWYFSRVMAFCAFLVLTSIAVWRFAGTAVALSCALVMITLPSFSDVFTRLGSAEAYGAVGVAAIIAGLALCIYDDIEGRKPGQLGYVLIGLGGVLSVGSKEVFILFCLPVIFSVYLLIRHKDARFVSWLSVVLALLVSAFMFKGLLGVLSSGRVSYLAEDIGFLDTFRRLASGVRSAVSIHSVHLTFSAALCSLMLVVSRWRGVSRKDTIRCVIYYALLVLFVVGITSSQYVFYVNEWPVKGKYTHYNFPGMFMPFVHALIIVSSVMYALGRNFPKFVTMVCSIAFLLIAAVYTYNSNIVLLNSVNHNLQRTGRTQETIENAFSTINDTGAQYVVVEAIGAHRSYEPSLSVIAFLRSKGISVPFYLRVWDKDESTARNIMLLESLKRKSESGRDGFRPIAELNEKYDPSSSCVSVFFEIPVKKYGCTPVRIRW